MSLALRPKAPNSMVPSVLILIPPTLVLVFDKTTGWRSLPTVGNRTTPSYMAFTSEEHLIGDAVKNQSIVHCPFTVIKKEGSPFIQVDYLREINIFSSQESSAMALTKLCHGPHQAQGDYQDQQ
ncbi:hypothetical protein MJO28_008215 [Puccinia striiformis f. sp. tritici]|uniref:non-chaperonin molecular chaperone ATPase n=2 Tax=Puccinia striiformis TaxID=27350 RepID=A0A2S4VV57_9BASI|nr:hypothetical protein MJO28_008215 [Puccinia striiformis f. sp. tritici]POW13380.1 hypothetical protein PSTT_03835 [Puccinia striiformis]